MVGLLRIRSTSPTMIREWGVPETDGKKLFEMICLEGQQAGLSSITVLKKRENYRACFHQFDPVRVAAMQEADVDRWFRTPELSVIAGKSVQLLAMRGHICRWSKTVSRLRISSGRL